MSLNWRYIYLASIAARFLVALSDSYIHPDEHFQSFEPLAPLLGYSANVPWEFTSTAPVRSYGVLMLIYYPVVALSTKFGLLPMQTWYLTRLFFMVASWTITDWCLYRMLPTKQERIKAIFFVLTSYVSLVYQSHTFSNSVETVLVVLTVYMVNELRFLAGSSQCTRSEVFRLGVGVGIVGAIGTFNRATFPAYFVLPAWYYVRCCWKWKFLLLSTAVPFAVVSYMLVVADTVAFTGADALLLLKNPFHAKYVVTPYNNLVYNTQYSNLATHGIHPFYTHLVANLPQLLGPGLLFLLFRLRNSYWRTTPFASATSGILFLSLVPHQELRFLIPVVPLFCCCFDVAALGSRLSTIGLNMWLVFNVALTVLMGVLHQGGVVPAVEYFHELHGNGVAQVWWRTYSPPTWMLGDRESSTQFIAVNDDKWSFTLDFSKQNRVVDTMGLDLDKLLDVIGVVKAASSKTYIIAPVASFKKNLDSLAHEQVWQHMLHLDMDHLDFGDMASLEPGLGIYELL